MRTQDNGLAVAFYAPSTTNIVINGNHITVNLTTNYPFGEVLQFVITANASFPFYLRIPGWCNQATVKVGATVPITVSGNQMYRLNLEQGVSNVQLSLPMSFRIARRYNDSVAIYRGPLLYALKMGEKWTQLKYFAYNSSDWEIDPTTPWNYALLINTRNPNSSIQFVSSTKVGPMPFSSDGMRPFLYVAYTNKNVH
jgi:DUF1680 family protein